MQDWPLLLVTACTAAQKNLDRLENWAERNLIKGTSLKFIKGKHKILLVGRNNPMDQYKLEANLLENRFLEKDQEVLEGNGLTMSQQCGCVTMQAYSLLGCIQERVASRLREVILPL
ncbi:hypothetical protein AV530_017109 [Patagioenas fasciata monilis]|uniref:Uncharacterized protein n=1 Tax=Patagioenas fasciata monilis TaxID=372326 RepID=A0A1V4JWX5_PATFA|nr:hypothetical protein AV530_017109 [Patagioenas fasciata monilis]